MTAPKPMDPEQLAELRRLIERRTLMALRRPCELLDLLLADRDYHAQRAEVHERERSDMSEAWDVLCGAVIEVLDMDSEQDEHIEDCEPDNACELAHALRSLRSDHLTETTGLISNANAVREQHAERVGRLLGRIESLEAEVARLRARVRVEAEDVERAGVTRAHVEAWLRANGWAAELGDYAPRVWKRGGAWVCIEPDSVAKHLAVIIRYIARSHRRPGLDILDEMAALEVGS